MPIADLMSSSKSADDLVTLKASITSSTALIQNFHLALRSSIPPRPDIKNPPQPLALLSDACKILKAQTTKLSLLVLNKPFTPTAITYILNVCSSSCLPAMMSALELCPASHYTQVLHAHIKSTLSKMMVELLNLLASIPHDEHGMDPQNRDTLASTGVLWAECDAMVILASTGLVLIANQKFKEYHDLLKDAIEELDDWDPEGDDTDSDTASLSSIEQRSATNMNSEPSLPSTDFQKLSISSIVELRSHTLVTLRTIRLLYPAIQKRRISTFPNITSATMCESLPSSQTIEQLDSTILSAKAFTELADEIAGALYESDERQVSTKLRSLQENAVVCASRVKVDWRGKEDDFSGWVDKWMARMTEVGKG